MRIAWLATIGVLASCGSKAAAPDDAIAVLINADAVAATAADAGAGASADAGASGRLEHAVFSLVDNRHATHRYADGDLVLDAADIGFARYTRFSMPVSRWHFGHVVDGARAAIADRLASLEVPLDAKMAKAIRRIVMRVHGHTKQRLAVVINGRRPTNAAKTSRVDLVEGWQTVALAVEPGRLGVGENEIAIETSGAKGTIAVEWIRFAAREGNDDPRGAAKFDIAGNAIVLAKDATVLWYVTMPESAHLVGSVAAPCKVEVQAIAGDDSFSGGALGPESARVDLSAMAGRVVGLMLTARECPQTRLLAPEIRVLGAAPVVQPASPPPRYIILWIMDGLRADKVPAFTPGARAQTPYLDELAKTSTVFRQFYVQGNESRTSHASFWTGLYPAVHNVRLAGKNGVARIDRKLDVLADELSDAGMYTVGLTGNGFVNDEGGYTRGFKEFHDLLREKNIAAGVLYGDDILASALARLDANRDKPTYLFLGTIDTHSPWIARKPWIDIYSPGPYDGPFKEYGTPKELGFRPDSMCSIIPPAPDIERLRAIYDSAVSYQDQLVGKLVAQLKSWGIWDQTLLVIASDHGEELFEDRRCGHGGSLRDSLVRVPLLVHGPARFPAGTIVDEGVEAVDVLPTLLAAFGAPAVDDAQGAPLAPLAQGIGRGWARPTYASMYEYAHAMRIGRWKARVGPAAVPFVADLVADPSEQIDLSRQRPVERRMLTDNLGLFLALRAQWKKGEWGVTTNVTTRGAMVLDGVMTP